METGTNMLVNELTQGPEQESELSASIELCMSLAQEILASIDKALSMVQSGGCPNLAVGPPDSPRSPRSPRSEITKQPFKAERTEMISKKRKTFWGQNSRRSCSPRPVDDDAADDDEKVLHVDDDKRRRSSSSSVTIVSRRPRLAEGTGEGGAESQMACQAEKCAANLLEAKRYHRFHRVCEAHSQAAVVIVAGLRQRFCQQCSKFHELAEFDDAKKTCLRRLSRIEVFLRRHKSRLLESQSGGRRKNRLLESQSDPGTKFSDDGGIQSRDVTMVGRSDHEMNGSEL